VNDRHRLGPEQLRWTCDHTKLGFKTTAKLKPLVAPIGQDRAVGALDFGVRIPSDGFNIFVLGPTGTGRTSMSRRVLEEVAAEQSPAGDWCYVHNFENPNSPKALHLPPGVACQFRADMDELVEDVRRELVAAFESDNYVERRDAVVKEFRDERQAQLEAFEKVAQEAGMIVGRGPAGFIVAPAKDGEVLTPQEYQELPEAERKGVDATRESLQEKLDEVIRRQQRREKEARAAVKGLNQEVATFAAGHLFEELVAKYGEYPRFAEHLDQIREDVIKNEEALRSSEDDQPNLPFPIQMPRAEKHWERYRVNVLLSCEPRAGAAVVYESNPTIDKLTGEVEHRTQMGALVTDFTMIRPGALHRANGGYLLLEAESLLRRPYAWEALKRALKNQEIRIESISDQLRFMSTVTLQPEPIPLQVKVVLVGTPNVYYLLESYDDDFGKLFKVKADFDTLTPRSAATVKRYAQFIAARCAEEGLPAFEAEAVAMIVEEAARDAGDQARLSTRFVDVADLTREAAYWSGRNGTQPVTAADVEKALAERVHRSNRIEERMLDLVDQRILDIDLDGKVVGQVNGLSIIPMPDYWFGRPNRITAKTYPGRAGVIQIDREAKLTGRSHDKGVLTLSGFLHDRYGQEQPLTMAASLTFEQSNSTIDGDSASTAELCAILSSLANAPIKQGIALTGAVSQGGKVQAIGGVNQKIEGFFESCRRRGLTGEQGVIIPKANARGLMLKREVVAAVAEGKFHVWSVTNVDQAMEILTGLPAGRAGKTGRYTKDSFNRRVQERLEHLADLMDGGRGERSPRDDDTQDEDNPDW
jgi:predicted ATP-dependent protease